MQVDVIILSNAKNEGLRSITQQAINSCLRSEEPETEIDFKILIIEQNEYVAYENYCKTLYDTSEFNYNKFMNKGIALGNAQYIALCNNDLIFYPGWCSTMIAAMEKHNLLSACPVCPHVQHSRLPLTEEIYFGYRNSHEVSGWCIMINRDILKIIGRLNEDFPFWFADNVYSEQLKSHNIKHGLVTKAIVEHLGGSTLNTLTKGEKNKVTTERIKEFIGKHPENESAIHFKKTGSLKIRQ